MTNLQLELLKLYSTNIPDHQLSEIRKLLSDFFAKQVDIQFEHFYQENQLNEATIEHWKNERMRTPYQAKN